MIKYKTINNTDFDTLFREYNSYVFKIVINESGNKLTKEDIEETVSDVFFLLWKNQSMVKDSKKIKSYIGKIANNATKNKLRSLKRSDLFDDNICLEFKSSSSYYLKEQIDFVHIALQSVDELDKRLFLLFYYDNKKIKEIAKIENLKASTIKTRLHRTRKKLKKVLERSGYKK